MRHAVTVILDLLILLDGEKITFERGRGDYFTLYELELKTGISISPMVMLKENFGKPSVQNTFYINVTNEGIVL